MFQRRLKMSSLRLPPEEYEALCKAILQRDGWKCRHCKSRNALHIHHIQFRSQQGPDESWNLIVLCSACHAGVHEYKLSIESLANADKEVKFFRVEGWRPQ